MLAAMNYGSKGTTAATVPEQDLQIKDDKLVITTISVIALRQPR
jgi:hypothetical protein